MQNVNLLHWIWRWIELTLYNAILRIARNFLETRENIKISTHLFYPINLDWFSWGDFLFFLLDPHENQSKFLGQSGWVKLLMITLVSSKFLNMRNIMLYSVRECVRNLDLRVQVHPGELWVSKQRVHIVCTRSLKISRCKRWCAKDLRVVHPLHPC